MGRDDNDPRCLRRGPKDRGATLRAGRGGPANAHPAFPDLAGDPARDGVMRALNGLGVGVSRLGGRPGRGGSAFRRSCGRRRSPWRGSTGSIRRWRRSNSIITICTVGCPAALRAKPGVRPCQFPRRVSSSWRRERCPAARLAAAGSAAWSSGSTPGAPGSSCTVGPPGPTSCAQW